MNCFVISPSTALAPLEYPLANIVNSFTVPLIFESIHFKREKKNNKYRPFKNSYISEEYFNVIKYMFIKNQSATHHSLNFKWIDFVSIGMPLYRWWWWWLLVFFSLSLKFNWTANELIPFWLKYPFRRDAT